MTQKLLAIKAHPFTKEKSTTVALLDQFLESYAESHPEDEITVLDLFATEIPDIDGTLLTAWETDPSEWTEAQRVCAERFDSFSNQFLEYDKIVIANPLWNMHVPTRLKAWLDTLLITNKTFRYTSHGPEGLVKGKKVMHLQSNGSPFDGQDPATKHIEGIFKFIGIHDVEHIFIDGKDRSAGRHLPKLAMEEAKEKAKEL